VSRLQEFLQGRFARDKIVFSGNRRRMTSVTVRGDQMAEELDGICVRAKYLADATLRSTQALVWVVEPNPEVTERARSLCPQILDVINPAYEPERREAFNARCRSFRYLLLNTERSLDYIGLPPEPGWRSWVVPHHHCNASGYLLPQDRVERPRVVGYVGQPEHLHDFEEIETAVRKMGVEFLNAATTDLTAYQSIDIGIAWTRRDSLRDDTRSNIKLTNFAAHGIPSVVCPYDSYEEVDRRLGGGACLIRDSLSDFIAGIADLIEDRDLRRSVHHQAAPALQIYSRKEIGEQYRQIVAEVQTDFSRSL
jgi:hypothetical protein